MNIVTLNNGVQMPLIAVGTYPLNGWRFSLLVWRAVRMGYRSFDLASAYGNERWFGRGMKLCGVRRRELFVTTKLSNSDQRRGDVRRALQNSLARLGTHYVDLYLMHWPLPGYFLASWKQMEEVHREGVARAIGVCNFHQHHLQALLDAAEVLPAVNQVELHPLLSQAGLVGMCRSIGIQVEAYSPFAQMHERLIDNPTLAAIAQRHRKTVPQVVLRWNLQKGIVPVPRTAHVARLRENLASEAFTLSAGDIEAVDNLNADFRVRHDPDHCDFSKL